MPYCTRDGVRLFYEVHGEGHFIIFLSGLSGGTWSWYRQIPYFCNKYRVIVCDNRGAGRSSMPPGPYKMEDFALDALTILKELDVKSVFVVGISMGGMIAQQLALIAPNVVKALVLGCTNCGRTRRIPAEPWVFEVLANREGLSQYEIVERSISILFGPSCREKHPEAIEEYRKTTLSAPPQPLEALKAQMAAINKFDACNELPSITCPTLVITGKADIIIPPGNSKIIAELIPSAQLVEWDSVGHAIHIEASGLFNTTVDSFFEQNAT